MLLMNPEKPDFFLIMPCRGSLPSSEYLLGLINWFSATRGADFSPDEELAECWRGMSAMADGSGGWARGGGGALRTEEL
jgi:hypothetical protein